MATGDDQKVHSKETQQISGDLKKKTAGILSNVFCFLLGDVHRFGLPRKNICGIKRDTEHEKAERYTWASRTGGNQKLSEFGHSSWGKRWIWKTPSQMCKSLPGVMGSSKNMGHDMRSTLLVGGFSPYPSEKNHWVKVSWDDDIPNWMEK